MRKLGLGTTVALIATPLMALPAWAIPACPTAGGISTYTATGYECTVDGGAITFSNISFAITTAGGGSVTLTSISPINPATGEYGLDLNYSATAPNANATADVKWSYDVSGNLLDDAYAAVTGTVTGSGILTVSESLTNSSTGVSLASINLVAPDTLTETVTYTPTEYVGVVKDLADYTGSGTGTSGSSDLQNAFSMTATPIPGALPLFAGGLVVLWALRKKPTKGRLNSALG